MPLIRIRKSKNVSDALLNQLIDQLQVIAARELKCDHSVPSPTGIMVEVEDCGPHDRNCKDLNIRIKANEYPQRHACLDEDIGPKIASQVAGLLSPGLSWYVWVILDTAFYSSDTDS